MLGVSLGTPKCKGMACAWPCVLRRSETGKPSLIPKSWIRFDQGGAYWSE